MLKAKRPLSVRGKHYSVGEEVPEELFSRERIPALREMGVIEETDMPVAGGAVSVKREIKEVFDKKKLQKAPRKEIEKLAAERGIPTKGLNKAQVIERLLNV